MTERYGDFENIIAQMPGLIFWKDLDGVYRGCNQGMVELWGAASIDNIIGKTDYELFSKELAEQFLAHDKEVMTTGKALQFEEKTISANGTRYLYIANKVPLQNKIGEIIGVLGTASNITLQKNLESELRTAKEIAETESQAKLEFIASLTEEITGQKAGRNETIEQYVLQIRNYLETIIAHMPGIVFWKDLDGIYRGCNNGLVEYMNLPSRNAIIGKKDHEIFGKEVAEYLIKNDQETIFAKKFLQFEETVIIQDRIQRTFITNKVPLKNHYGEIVGILGTSSDITTQKKLVTDLEIAKDAVFKLAAQVAHDIRSPLVALDILLKDINTLPEKQRNLVRSATQRINDIANNLLLNYTQPTGLKDTPIVAEPIFGLVDSVLSEKRVQFIQRNIQFNEKIANNMYDAFIKVEPIAFKRVLSNLLNNAAEAITDTGNVEIAIEQNQQQQIILHITDTGCGIPADKLPLIAQSGVTFGKQGGSGLGLTYAVEKIKEWQGDYAIESTVGIGTTVTITLPIVEPAAWFAKPAYFATDATIVVLDDDPSIHEVWQSRYQELVVRHPALKIVSFYQPTDLVEFHHANKNKHSIYFIDYELIGKAQTGIELIAALDIAKQSYLVTSRYENKAIREQCTKLGLTIIPKPYSAHIPLQVVDLIPDAILIDDDELLRSCWEMDAFYKNKKLISFANPAGFLVQAHCFDKATPIYIDSTLSNNVKGEIAAKEIYDLGFHTVYLATGYPPSHFPDMPWIKEIVGKEIPW